MLGLISDIEDISTEMLVSMVIGYFITLKHVYFNCINSVVSNDFVNVCVLKNNTPHVTI